MALPHATIHMHLRRRPAPRYAPDVRSSTKTEAYAGSAAHILPSTPISLSPDCEDFDRDYFMDPTAAVEYGIIDEVPDRSAGKTAGRRKEEG